jgi:hypothetical protein
MTILDQRQTQGFLQKSFKILAYVLFFLNKNH